MDNKKEVKTKDERTTDKMKMDGRAVAGLPQMKKTAIKDQ
jgi:hypothetical protein